MDILGIISVLLLLALLRYVFRYIFRYRTPRKLDRERLELPYDSFPATLRMPMFKNECENHFDENTTRLCKRLETETSMYTRYPLELDIAEVWKFCVVLIGMEETLGKERDTILRNLMSCFVDVQNLLLDGLNKQYFTFFQEAWLLEECEGLFRNYDGTVIEKIRQSIYARDKARHDAESSTEIYYQRMQHPLLRYPHRWQNVKGNDYRKMFHDMCIPQGSIRSIGDYVEIFWYTYEEELLENERIQEIIAYERPFNLGNSRKRINDEFQYNEELRLMEIRSRQRAHGQRIIRGKVLRIYLKCLSYVLSHTCLLAISKFARSRFMTDWPYVKNNKVQQQLETGLANEKYASPKRWQPAPSQPQFTKHEHEDATPSTHSSPVTDLQASLRRGACIYLSGAMVLESVTVRGKKCVEISGLEGEHRKQILSKGGKAVRIGNKEHILLALGNVPTMSYILSKSRVINTFDATARELFP